MVVKLLHWMHAIGFYFANILFEFKFALICTMNDTGTVLNINYVKPYAQLLTVVLALQLIH